MNTYSSATDHSVLKKIKGEMIEVLSFFKGVKLLSKEKIINIDDNKLTIKPSNKQKLNLLCNKRYFIIVDNQHYIVEDISYSNDKGYLIFHNISEEPHKELHRDEVRLELNYKKAYIDSLKKSFFVHDISEKSLSILSRENIDIQEISNIDKLTLSFINSDVYVEFLKKAKLKDKNKYIFLITKRNEDLIEYIYEMQRNILKQYSSQLQKL